MNVPAIIKMPVRKFQKNYEILEKDGSLHDIFIWKQVDIGVTEWVSMF